MFSYDDDDEDEDDDLPYPEPLPRSVFLDPAFSPQTYLSTLRNRHQTLEDLRAELRARSQLLSRELVDLVNSHYQDFLGLGASLKGGDDKVENLRVGLLGLRREIESLRKVVGERRGAVENLLDERKKVARQVETGRRLLEFERRLTELEGRLLVEGKPEGQASLEGESEEDDEDEDEDEEGEVDGLSMSLPKLKQHVNEFVYLKALMEYLSFQHPFIVAQQSRVDTARTTLLIDLSTALKESRKVGEKGTSRLLTIISLYRKMGEAAEGVKVLKEAKK